jgi:hypothetical protein
MRNALCARNRKQGVSRRVHLETSKHFHSNITTPSLIRSHVIPCKLQMNVGTPAEISVRYHFAILQWSELQKESSETGCSHEERSSGLLSTGETGAG